MHISAGKTWSNRYTKKAPVHIAIVQPEEAVQGLRSLCNDHLIAPIGIGSRIEITCKACQEKVTRLQELLLT